MRRKRQWIVLLAGVAFATLVLLLSHVSREERLLQAIRENDVSQARDLIAAGVDVHYRHYPDKPWQSFTALHRACSEGRFEIVEALIEAGADVNALDARHETPLLHIVNADDSSNHLACMRLLLKHGASPDEVDDAGNTPLMYAVRYGKLDLVRELLAAGADVHRQNVNQWTVLHNAADLGSLLADQTSRAAREAKAARNELIPMLLDAGVDPTIRSIDGRTARDMLEESGFRGSIELLEQKTKRE